MSHQTPPPAFWADKEKRWIARAQAFNVATAASAVAALNQHIGSSAGSLSSQKVVIQQGADGLFAWTPSSLRLLRQMGEDVSILDDIGRTTTASSPVKGINPSPPTVSVSFSSKSSIVTATGTAFWGGDVVRPAWVSGLETTAASVGRGGGGVLADHACASPTPQDVMTPRCIRGWIRTRI